MKCANIRVVWHAGVLCQRMTWDEGWRQRLWGYHNDVLYSGRKDKSLLVAKLVYACYPYYIFGEYFADDASQAVTFEAAGRSDTEKNAFEAKVRALSETLFIITLIAKSLNAGGEIYKNLSN